MDKTDKSSFVDQGVVNPQYTPVQTNQYFVPCQMLYAQQPYKKLFVGQIPKTFSEEDVKKIFSTTCQVYAAHIIKDKVTKEHRGCAFIYVDPSVAELVKEKYHNKYCCPKVFALDRTFILDDKQITSTRCQSFTKISSKRSF